MINFKKLKPLKDYDSVSLAELLRSRFVLRFPVEATHRLGDAIQVASFLHRNDVRRGARGVSISPPYIEHPLRVSLRMAVHFGSDDANLLIAAILHDTVEDHAHEFSEFEGVLRSDSADVARARARALEFISTHFGYAVAAIVEDVSNPIMLGSPNKEEKILAYQQHVEAVVSRSPQALLLKFSDFVDNAGSLHHHYEYNDSSVQYFVNRYAPLIPIYRRGLENLPGNEFNVLTALNRLDHVQEQFARFHS